MPPQLMDEDVYYNEERVSLFDMIMAGITRNYWNTFIFTLNMTFWFGLMCFLGGMAEIIWEDNRDAGKFDWAMWIICIICFAYLFSAMHFTHILGIHPCGPFKRATYSLLLPVDDSKSGIMCITEGFSGSWLLSWLICWRCDKKARVKRDPNDQDAGGTIVTGTRNVMYTTHMVCIGLVFTIWTILSDDSSDEGSLRMRFKGHMEAIRLMGYIWILAVPTFSGGVVDAIQLNNSDNPAPGHVWHRALYASYALLLKFLICVNLIILLDPTASYFFKVAGNNSDFETATISAVSMTLLVATICFWISYDCVHWDSSPTRKANPKAEKVFAFAEFPAFLALILKSAWQIFGQFRGQHDNIADQAVGGDFVFFAGYIILMTFSTLSLPSHIDFAKHVQFVETQRYSRLTEKVDELSNIISKSPFVVVRAVTEEDDHATHKKGWFSKSNEFVAPPPPIYHPSDAIDPTSKAA